MCVLYVDNFYKRAMTFWELPSQDFEEKNSFQLFLLSGDTARLLWPKSTATNLTGILRPPEAFEKVSI